MPNTKILRQSDLAGGESELITESSPGSYEDRMYVIQTISRTESRVKEFLEKTTLTKNESLWIPERPKYFRAQRQWIQIKEILLPGYILLDCPDPWDFRSRCEDHKSTQSIHLIGRYNAMKMDKRGNLHDDFLEVEERELELINLLCSGVSEAIFDATKAIKKSIKDEKAAERSLYDGLGQGSGVRVTSGPLVGLEGYIRKIDRHHRSAILRLPLFGQEIDVTLSCAFFNAIESGESDAENTVEDLIKAGKATRLPRQKRYKPPYPAYSVVDYAGIIDGDEE